MPKSERKRQAKNKADEVDRVVGRASLRRATDRTPCELLISHMRTMHRRNSGQEVLTTA